MNIHLRHPFKPEHSRGYCVSLALVIAACLFAQPHANAQEAHPDLTRLKLEAERAKAEAEIAKAQRDIFNASLPASTSKGLEGKLELDKVNIEAHIQTYAALKEAMKAIAKDVSSTGAKVLVVRSAADVNALLALRSLEQQVAFLKEQYKKVEAPGAEVIPPLLAPQLLSSLLGSFGDIAAFFKTETKISGVDVTLNNSAVVPELAKALNGSVRVYYPEIAPANLLQPNPGGYVQIVNDLDALAESYAKASPTVTALLNIKNLEARVAAAKDPKERVEFEEQLKKAREDPAARHKRGPWLVALNAGFEKLLASLSEIDSSGASNMTKLMSVIELRDLLKKDGTYLLELTAQKGGGNNKTKRSVFSSGRDYYSGGAIVSYTLFGSGGAIVCSGNTSVYQKYARPSEIRRANQDSHP